MLGHRELTIQDYMDILKRRLWLILLATIVVLGIAVGFTYWIPPQYTSQTLVLIEQQKVPTDYVMPVLTEDLDERLASLREQILSRSRLEPIIQRFNLFAGNGATMEDRVEQTQKAIEVKPIVGGPRGIPGFYITFKSSDPRTAQQVCGELTSLFVSENLNAREESAEGTEEFLKQQLADAKASLDQQDEKLADFERKYIGRLPNQESSNQSTLEALTKQLDATTQSLDRLQQDQAFIQSNLTAHENDAHDSSPSGTLTIDDKANELKALEEQKKNLEAVYTADYPDVQEVNRKIAELQAEIAHPSSPSSPAKSAPAATSSDPPIIAQEKMQLKAVQLALNNGKTEQDKLQKQIQAYEARIDASPIVEEQYKQVTRDHDIALEFYNSLLKKMDESSMATALEHRQEGEQFRVMDPPNLPESPSFPNRQKFAAMGLAGGLMLGLTLAALLEYRDTTLRTELDVWAFTKLPTLAVLSHIKGMPTTVTHEDGGKSFATKDLPAESVGG